MYHVIGEQPLSSGVRSLHALAVTVGRRHSSADHYLNGVQVQ